MALRPLAVLRRDVTLSDVDYVKANEKITVTATVAPKAGVTADTKLTLSGTNATITTADVTVEAAKGVAGTAVTYEVKATASANDITGLKITLGTP